MGKQSSGARAYGPEPMRPPAQLADKDRQQVSRVTRRVFLAVVGHGELLMLLPLQGDVGFIASARAQKSGGTTLLAPSFSPED